MDFLGDVGGLTDALMMIMAAMIGFYASKMFNISFVKANHFYRHRPTNDRSRRHGQR